MKTTLSIGAFEVPSSKNHVFQIIRKTWTFIILFLMTWSAFAGPITGPTCIEVGQPGSYSLLPESPNYGLIDWWSDVNGDVVIDPLNPTKVSVTPTNLNPTFVVLTAGVNYNQAPWYKTYSYTIQIGCANIREGIQGPACVDKNKEYDFNVIAPYNGYTSIVWSTNGSGTFDVDVDPSKATLHVGSTNPATITITTAITYADASRNKTFTTTVDVGCGTNNPLISGPSCVEPIEPNQFTVVPSANNYTSINWFTTGNGTITPVSASDPTLVTVAYTRGNPSSVTLTAVVKYADPSKNEALTLNIQVGGCTQVTPVITGPDCADLLKTYTYTVTPSNNNYSTITWSSTGNATIIPDLTDPAKATVMYAAGSSSAILTADITYVDATLNESIHKTLQIGECTPNTPVITGPDCLDLLTTYTFTVTPSYTNYVNITWSSTGNATVTKDLTDPTKVTVKYAAGSSSAILTADVTYANTTRNESIHKTLKIGNCSNTPGITGPTCVELDKPYTFILTSAQNNYYWIDWWADKDATIVKDINNPKQVTVTFTSLNNPGSIATLTAGVDYSSAPWWNKYSIQVKLGGCAVQPSVISSQVVLAPQPFVDESTLSLSNGDDIMSLKVFDRNGIEVVLIDNVNAKQVKVGHGLMPGLYAVQVIGNTGVFRGQFIKAEY